ncbi:MAG TPA: sulfatase [Thermoguttaceae bacterium]|nr:sulfatase [Thermoguttaceae bacterium]
MGWKHCTDRSRLDASSRDADRGRNYRTARIGLILLGLAGGWFVAANQWAFSAEVSACVPPERQTPQKMQTLSAEESVKAQSPQQPARPNILLCIADDWGWPHAGAYGDPVVQTPTFDRLAREGVLFTHAFVTAPTCTASRGGILTGQAIHRLEEGANLWSRLPAKFRCYPDLLREAGYEVGFQGKGWAPGTLEGTGRTENPAGPRYKNFQQFLDKLPAGKPFCFWFGSTDPHRPYELGSGAASGMDPAKVRTPGWLPDTPTVRSDLCDYYFEVQRFDRDVGQIIALLENRGLLENTLVVITGDNGPPFPRGKANLYDAGCRAPLVVAWKGKVPGGRRVDDFVSLADLAPTFLEAAGLKPLPEMTGRSLLTILCSDKSGQVDPTRDHVFLERERHAWVRPEGKSYPIRAIRTAEFLYLRNFRPELWPAGDPDFPNVVGFYGDVDGSPTKTEILQRQAEPAMAPFYQRAFAKRPAEELYDLRTDPDQLHNVAGKPEYADIQAKLRSRLEQWMQQTGDPRAQGETDRWDAACPYVGQKTPKEKP